jgi:hypothetical protein
VMITSLLSRRLRDLGSGARGPWPGDCAPPRGSRHKRPLFRPPACACIATFSPLMLPRFTTSRSHTSRRCLSTSHLLPFVLQSSQGNINRKPWRQPRGWGTARAMGPPAAPVPCIPSGPLAARAWHPDKRILPAKLRRGMVASREEKPVAKNRARAGTCPR